MNWHILLRSVFLSIPRFFVITVLMTLYAWIDWSPLPEQVMLVIVSALTQFVVMYLFARWAFGKYLPHWKEAVLSFLIFLAIQISCEAWYQAIRTGGDFFKLVTTYNWWSLLTVMVYLVAFWLAFERSHSKYRPETPEGIAI